MYPDVSLYIDGVWRQGSSGRRDPVINPATGDVIGHVALADIADLDQALAAVERGFRLWKATSAHQRYTIMRRAAEIVRERHAGIAGILTREQGKTLAQATTEVMLGADLIDWFAEEGRRAYGRIIPSRSPDVQQLVTKEPVGPVAAFTPWNFPINQAVRKLSAALAAGCSVILKASEETPGCCAALVQAFEQAGVPAGVVNLVFGVPSEISDYLVPHPVIRKVTFTGSTAVGKHLAGLAGQHMKRSTMELGGHAPAIVFADADVDVAIRVLVQMKFRNAGQACVSPTRFLAHEQVYDRFVEGFSKAAAAMTVGDGLDPDTQVGPLANIRRLDAMEAFVADAVARGARIVTGGNRVGNNGFFFAPTVLTDVPLDAKVMVEEPFGPLAPIVRFHDFDEAVAEANRLPYGLAAYAYTRSLKTASAIAAAVESGMVSINHHGLALPELPFGGVKDSGYGTEGGADALNDYFNTKLVTQMAA